MEKYDLILQEIKSLKEFFTREFQIAKSERDGIREELQFTKEEHEKRLRLIEDWKLVFVTKFSTYATIALIIGSFAGTIINKFISKYI